MEAIVCEYYCTSCGQLRLFLADGEPTTCGNCGSEDIDVDNVGSERLWRKRHPEVNVQTQEGN